MASLRTPSFMVNTDADLQLLSIGSQSLIADSHEALAFFYSKILGLSCLQEEKENRCFNVQAVNSISPRDIFLSKQTLGSTFHFVQ